MDPRDRVSEIGFFFHSPVTRFSRVLSDLTANSHPKSGRFVPLISLFRIVIFDTVAQEWRAVRLVPVSRLSNDSYFRVFLFGFAA